MVCTFLVRMQQYVDFSHTEVHECVLIRTGLPLTKVKDENEARFYSKVNVSFCVITSVRTQNILSNP